MKPAARGELVRAAIELGRHASISYRPDQRRLLLRLPLPVGWTPRIGCLRIELSDNYPQEKPDVLLPSAYRYHGQPWIETGLRPPLAPVQKPWMKMNHPGISVPPDGNPIVHHVSTIIERLGSPSTVPNRRDPDQPSPGIGWGEGTISRMKSSENVTR